MKVTKKRLEEMDRINRMSKGWPVGIPTTQAMAKYLVDNKLAEWAPPASLYLKKVYPVRLTSLGKAILTIETVK